MTTRAMPRVAAAALAVAVAALAVRATAAWWWFATAARELPLWDEAKYGLDGSRLAGAIADLDLARFASLVYQIDVWPPLFPLVEAFVLLAAGDQFGVVRALVATLYLGLVLAAFWAGREIARESPAVAVVAAALVLQSPFVQLFSGLVMLEVPGALLYLASLAAYARFLRTGGRRALLATGLSTCALFFTKYNYALLWLAPLAASEAAIASGGVRAALRRAGTVARRVDWRRPWNVFIALYLAALAAILTTGGGTARIAGRDLSMTSIGNPLYLLLAILALRAAWSPRRCWRRWKQWELALADRHRVLLWTVVIPAAVWLALPPHLRSFVDFVENRGGGASPWSVEGLLYYSRVFVEEYHAAPLLGIAALASALAALARIDRASPGQRMALLAMGIGAVSTTLHPYKEPRFFLVVAPVIWLVAAWSATMLVESAVPRLRRWTSAVLVLAALAAAARLPAASPRAREAFVRYTVPASTALVTDRVTELAAERPTLVLGTWNQLAAPLLEWRLRQRHPDAAPPELVFPFRRAASAGAIERRLRAPGAPEQVVAIEPAPEDPRSAEWVAAFTAETAWLTPLYRRLENGDLPYRLERDEAFPGTGYRVRVFRAVS